MTGHSSVIRLNPWLSSFSTIAKVWIFLVAKQFLSSGQ